MRNTVDFSHKAVYYQSSAITEQTKEVWFVLHGYGQLPQYFIRKFSSIANQERVIIAPGGLSRFYLNGYSGRVGSTWMTKEERLLDISNYIEYLNAIVAQVLPESLENIELTLLGFSQGSATVCRWAEQLELSFDRLILHSGAFPIDIDFTGLSQILAGKEVYMLQGNDDEFINEEREIEQKELIAKWDIEVQQIKFEGRHDIHIDSLKQIIEQ